MISFFSFFLFLRIDKSQLSMYSSHYQAQDDHYYTDGSKNGARQVY